MFPYANYELVGIVPELGSPGLQGQCLRASVSRPFWQRRCQFCGWRFDGPSSIFDRVSCLVHSVSLGFSLSASSSLALHRRPDTLCSRAHARQHKHTLEARPDSLVPREIRRSHHPLFHTSLATRGAVCMTMAVGKSSRVM
jgi:hypothetical protein